MEKKQSRVNVRSNYIYNLLYEVLILLVPLVTTPYISRVLGADGIGIYSYTLSIVTYFALVGKLGMSTYGQLQVARHRDEKEKISYLFWEIVILRFLTMSISALVYLLLIVYSKEYSIYYTLLLIYLLSCALDFAWFLQGLEEFKKIVFRNTIVKLLTVILIFTCIRHKSDLYKYFIIIQGSSLIGNIVILPQIKKYTVKINWREIKIFRHLKACLIYFIPTIATTIYLSIDKSMIGWVLKSNFENGYYEQANKIEQVIVTVVTSLSVIMLPRMAYLFKNKEIGKMKELLDNSIKFVLFISIPMAFGLTAIAPTLVPWFLGVGYNKCITILSILSCLIVVVGLNNVVGKQILMACGKQKEYNYSVIIGAIVNVIINCILIPIFGSSGAAIASVCAETVILIMFINFGREFVSIFKIFKYSIKYFISSCIMFISITSLNNNIEFNTSIGSIFMKVIIGFIVYMIGLLVLRDKFIFDQIKTFFSLRNNKCIT